ncbi:DUF3047 domain-containing protein [Sulfuricystis multivorans]|uniref:DUF3047 domain-containing protein n=1 Tax=Sulfuricystis multivorans TaxID=2211108 RepID=UPI000F82AE1B|nr:DUF3047 domain-containing protein [Sulfuricystis multivorans]
MKRNMAWLMLPCALAALAEPRWVGRFPASGGIPAPWRIERLNEDIAPTRYRLRDWEGVPAVEAHAVSSMALLARPLEIDLNETPILCWRWRIDAPLKNADMTTKAGDDYAARVYLSFAVPPDTLGLGTRMALGLARSLRGNVVPDAAINYIWDNRQPVGTWQPNAYTDRARMLVLRSGAGQANRWVSERRDVSADFQRAFGHAPAKLTGLALASDTDNTGEQAHAGFADFAFVGRKEPCP